MMCDCSDRIPERLKSARRLLSMFISEVYTIVIIFVFFCFIYFPIDATAVPIDSTSLMPELENTYFDNFLGIGIENNYYQIEEIVNISLSYPEELSGRLYLEIYNLDFPQYLYRYLDLTENNILFFTTEVGRYSVKLYTISDDVMLSQEYYEIVSQKEFMVYAAGNDCETKYLGMPFEINLRDNQYYPKGMAYQNIYLIHYDKDDVQDGYFKYSDTLSDSIYFPNPVIGRYDLLIDDNYIGCYRIYNIYDSASTESAEASQSYPIESGAENYIPNILGVSASIETESMLRKRYYEEKDFDAIRAILGGSQDLQKNETTALSYKLTYNIDNDFPYVKLSDSSGMFKNAFMVFRDNKAQDYFEGNLLDINSMNISGDDYQADIYFSNSTLKKIRINRLNYSKNLDLGVEELSVEELIMTRVSRGDFINAFAIDPTRMQFDDAVVTFTAVGNALWKCKDYNFDTQTCNGDFVKILDMVPGNIYSFILTPEDPVFAQSNYLVNPSFTSNTSGWSTQTEGNSNNLFYAWVSSDAGYSGVAEIRNQAVSGTTRTGSYYQTFNLSLPPGTNLTNITFSVDWRISSYNNPGSVHLWIQNSARTVTYCSWNQSFSSTTSWATQTLRTGSDCSLSSFNVSGIYAFRMRCVLVTSTARNEQCHWDNANVTVYYIDVQAPNITSLNATPNPVNYSMSINFTANITDNIQVDAVWILINGTNYTMNYASNGTYYFDAFNTTRYPMNYTYIVYANDTSSNIVNRTANFTINDNLLPSISLMTPEDSAYSNVSNTYFYYNVSEESTIANCSLTVNGTVRATNMTVQRYIQQSLNVTLSQGIYYWNITCYDNSTNRNKNTSITRIIIVDTTRPSVALNYPGNNTKVSGGTSRLVLFNYTPNDINLNNCSIYGNFSGGAFGLNQTNSTPTSGVINGFLTFLNDGVYRWNVQCCDKANNCAFNSTNYTVTIDSTPPYWSNNLTNPSSGVVWSNPRTYQFNITWNDTRSNISRVWIEHNFTGVLQNYSVQNISNRYYYNVSNLSAGRYILKWYANDSLNNINSTEYYEYIVNKAQSSILLMLNGSDNDINISQYGIVNITAMLMNPSTGYIELYQDGGMINSGNAILTNITQYVTQLQYNITATYPATQNYSSASITHFITVTDTISPLVSLGGPEDNSWNPKMTIFYYTPNDNIDITNCTLILDGINNETKNSTIGIENNFTVNVSDGIHNWTVGCFDSKNNYGQNTTIKYVRVDTLAPSMFNLISPINNSVRSNNTPTLTWNQTIESNFKNYTVLVDNNFGFLFPDYIYTISSISDTIYQVPSFNPWSDNVWYWEVVAYDTVLNSYVSGYYKYTLDTQPPVINILVPENNQYSNNLMQDFNFTLSDFTEIANCSLIIDGFIEGINTTINKTSVQSFTKYFVGQGQHNWSIECYDEAGNMQMTALRYLILDQTPPSAFTILNPQNNSLSNNNTPVLSWSATSEQNFANYTIYLSDDVSFSYYNYTYLIDEISNTTFSLGYLIDTVWYWRITAYDEAGNNYTTGYHSYEIDTNPPDSFTLLYPENVTSANNKSPLLNWSQTYDVHFKNYTVQVSDDELFSASNFTYTTSDMLNTTYQAIDWPMNNIWYWRVIAFDEASNNYTTESFTYITDNSTPVVSLVSPSNSSVWNSSTTVPFIFNVSDISPIMNCSLILNGEISDTIYDVDRFVNQTIYEGMTNGVYNWSVNCTDKAGYEGRSATRNITVNVTLPRYTLYETNNSGTALLSNPATASLNMVYDYVENYVQATISAGVNYNIANGSTSFNGSGFLLYANTLIRFSGVFQAGTRNTGYVNWGLYKQNSSGVYLICQTPNGTSGSQITTRNAKETETGSCTSPGSNIRFNTSDRLLLMVRIYSSSTVTYMHYMDNANPSYVQLDGYKLGVLNVTLFNSTDQQPGEGHGFIEKCNVSCMDGYCIDTDIHLEINNSDSQDYILIGSSGRIILNGSQYNPVVLGTINSSISVNASLYANIYSDNNSFRCYAESLYSNSTSNIKNITVRDITYPTVALISPGLTHAADPGVIEFSYIPYDKRLRNCTIYTNASSFWIQNQTNSTLLNGSQNNFFINFQNYGIYLWNIQCCDSVGNCAFNESNRTLNIAGNLAITDDDIYFSDSTPAEFENVTIFARIHNLANRIEKDVLVRFYEGDPDFGGTILGNVYINISGLSEHIVNISVIASKGVHQYYVNVDPLGNIIESDESNNKAYNTTFTAVWQVYYGNLSVVMRSLGYNNNTLVNWTMDGELKGNIFISDSDSSITWTSLQALTRDVNNNIISDTKNDFEELDYCLGTTAYGDNINITYSINGLPESTSTYDIYNRLIENVPDSQSTNTTNFYTGILWDMSDSAGEYYSCNSVPSLREDIVFVGKINEATVGGLGTYDYEIRVPGELGNYKGANSAVSFYYEII